MRTAVVAGACAALLAVGTGANAPALAPPDLEAEIAWARTTWPADFEGLHFHAPLGKLRAWVAHGPVPVYIFNSDFACHPGTLFPPEARRDEGEARDHEDANASLPRPMTAKIVGRSRLEGGRSLREVRYVAVDFELSKEDGSTFEARGEDGRWHFAESSGGYGLETTYGALSSVDERVARWGGETQVIRPYCGGLVEWLGCAGGGERPCVRCEEVRALVVSPRSLYGHSVSPGNRQVTCHDPCPNYPESPSVERLRALSSRALLWRARKEPIAAVPSLYKSHEDCLREHPQVARGGTR